MLKLVCMVLFFFSLPVISQAQFISRKLDKIVADFEKHNSKSAVIIINSRSGQIKYIYNKDYAIRKNFPPGSLAKVWSAVIFLENSKEFNFNYRKRIRCNGKFFLPPEISLSKQDRLLFNLQNDKAGNQLFFKCAIRSGHGSLSLHRAIVDSCNVYFLTIASRNPQIFYKRLFDLWKLNYNSKARVKSIREYPSMSFRQVYGFQAIAAAIGEGGNIRVSPLKVAQTYAAFIEGTPFLSPYLAPYKNKLQQYPLQISKRNRDIIISALAEVVKVGTLKGLNKAGKNITVIAGKTGTGTHFRKKYITHAWNAIYFQKGKEKYVMTVFVYKGRGGKEARQLSERILNAL